MEHEREHLLQTLWSHYADITPSAPRIHTWLQNRGESLKNDHIALRTFDLSPIALADLEPLILGLGYQMTGEYSFEVKKLRARSYSVPGSDAPRIFLSELRTAQMPESVQAVARDLAAQVDARGLDLLTSPMHWTPVTRETYEGLREVSEYAAWLSVFGLRANHFTVAVNALQSFGQTKPLAVLCDALQAQGVVLNTSGGVIKGSKADLLEQASTLADQTEVIFAGGERGLVPSCYIEFAWRHQDPNTDGLFDGFVTASADRIFESTDAR